MRISDWSSDVCSSDLVDVAKRLVVAAQRQGGQSQFSPFLTAPMQDDSPIVRVQTHVMAHVGDRHTLSSLAGVAGMSTRNFARHFVQRSEEHTSELQSLMRISYAVFCLTQNIINRLNSQDEAL